MSHSQSRKPLNLEADKAQSVTSIVNKKDENSQSSQSRQRGALGGGNTASGGGFDTANYGASNDNDGFSRRSNRRGNYRGNNDMSFVKDEATINNDKRDLVRLMSNDANSQTFATYEPSVKYLPGNNTNYPYMGGDPIIDDMINLGDRFVTGTGLDSFMYGVITVINEDGDEMVTDILNPSILEDDHIINDPADPVGQKMLNNKLKGLQKELQDIQNYRQFSDQLKAQERPIPRYLNSLKEFINMDFNSLSNIDATKFDQISTAMFDINKNLERQNDTDKDFQHRFSAVYRMRDVLKDGFVQRTPEDTTRMLQRVHNENLLWMISAKKVLDLYKTKFGDQNLDKLDVNVSILQSRQNCATCHGTVIEGSNQFYEEFEGLTGKEVTGKWKFYSNGSLEERGKAYLKDEHLYHPNKDSSRMANYIYYPEQIFSRNAKPQNENENLGLSSATTTNSNLGIPTSVQHHVQTPKPQGYPYRHHKAIFNNIKRLPSVMTSSRNIFRKPGAPIGYYYESGTVVFDIKQAAHLSQNGELIRFKNIRANSKPDDYVTYSTNPNKSKSNIKKQNTAASSQESDNLPKAPSNQSKNNENPSAASNISSVSSSVAIATTETPKNVESEPNPMSRSQMKKKRLAAKKAEAMASQSSSVTASANEQSTVLEDNDLEVSLTSIGKRSKRNKNKQTPSLNEHQERDASPSEVQLGNMNISDEETHSRIEIAPEESEANKDSSLSNSQEKLRSGWFTTCNLL
jgi:hypothetical protein